MTLPLREVLRRFCVEVGWSYAILWRVIPNGDQMLLKWGDGHCERIVEGPDISGYQNPTEGNVVEHIWRSQDELSTLVNSVMVSQVHVMGAGIVGEAALTSTYQCIFQCDLNDYCLALPELNKQFSAGIQTLAIIPVTSHGVLQFGSVNTVIEDISFVNFTRGLFTQTRYVPAAILSDISSSCLNEKVPEYEFPAQPPNQSDKSGYIKSNQFHYQYGGASALESVIQLYLDTDFVLTKQNSSSLCMPLRDIFGRGNTLFSYFIKLEHWLSGNKKRNKLPDIRWFRNANPPTDDETQLCSCSSMVMEGPLLDASCSRSQVVDTKNGCRLSNSVITQLKSCVSICAFPPDGLNTRMHSEKTSSMNKQYGLSVAKEIKNCFTVSASVEASQDLAPTNYPTGIEMLSQSPKSRTHSLIKMFKATWMTGKQKLEQDVSQDLGVTCRENQDYRCRNVGASPEVLRHLYEESSYASSQTVNRDDSLAKLDFESMFEPLHYSLIDYISWSDKLNSHDSDMDDSACISLSSSCHNVDALRNLVYWNVKPEETNPAQLLDAVISKFNYCAKRDRDACIHCKTSSVANCSHSSAKVHAMCSSSVQFPGESFLVCIPLKADGAESDIFASITDNIVGICAINATCQSQISSQSGNCQNTINDIISPKKRSNAGEAGKFIRKRVRPGQNRTRLRPKDHKMVQDCLDVLREIVPDGKEYTIDTLLDKTIKHMLFLRSVINHAEKLKKSEEPRITKEERGLLLKDNFVGGATWAFEVGSKFLTCPIIVEDINSPCQMLVEMLCEEQGLFLEIADSIRGLGLTILKGVMEARNTKVWARFAVKANRDVTRMEIVLSLIRLLDPSGGSNITQGDGGVGYR